jgi:hypothetical protein
MTFFHKKLIRVGGKPSFRIEVDKRRNKLILIRAKPEWCTPSEWQRIREWQSKVDPKILASALKHRDFEECRVDICQKYPRKMPDDLKKEFDRIKSRLKTNQCDPVLKVVFSDNPYFVFIGKTVLVRWGVRRRFVLGPMAVVIGFIRDGAGGVFYFLRYEFPRVCGILKRCLTSSLKGIAEDVIRMSNNTRRWAGRKRRSLARISPRPIIQTISDWRRGRRAKKIFKTGIEVRINRYYISNKGSVYLIEAATRMSPGWSGRRVFDDKGFRTFDLRGRASDGVWLIQEVPAPANPPLEGVDW